VNTEQLIESLSRNVPRVSRHALGRRIRYGLYGGGVIAAALVVSLLGVRPDLSSAVESFSFWMKTTYTISVGVLAVVAVSRLARPTPASLRGLWLLAVPVLVLAGIAIGELANTPTQDWLALWLGGSWRVCPWILLALAMPMLLGLGWSFRKFAPRHLRAAGAAAGLASGAWAAAIYCLHCPESAALFVLTWYSLGMVLATLIGALLGPRLMRW
jgi:hypothetical protein